MAELLSTMDIPVSLQRGKISASFVETIRLAQRLRVRNLISHIVVSSKIGRREQWYTGWFGWYTGLIIPSMVVAINCNNCKYITEWDVFQCFVCVFSWLNKNSHWITNQHFTRAMYCFFCWFPLQVFLWFCPGTSGSPFDVKIKWLRHPYQLYLSMGQGIPGDCNGKRVQLLRMDCAHLSRSGKKHKGHHRGVWDFLGGKPFPKIWIGLHIIWSN